jgi:methylated-DNA-protein-cysteine methyltransferase related protein
MNTAIPTIKSQIIEIVSHIPEGKVMYFGQVGNLVLNSQDSFGISGQVVGFVLSGMPSSEWELLPWHRVVAKDGFISSLKLGAKGLIQKQLLLDEGVEIVEDRVDMTKHLFDTKIGEAEVLF